MSRITKDVANRKTGITHLVRGSLVDMPYPNNDTESPKAILKYAKKKMITKHQEEMNPSTEDIC